MYYDKYMVKIFLRSFACLFTLLCFISSAFSASAHEQYVLTKQQLDMGFSDKSMHVLDALKSPQNVMIAILVGIGIAIVLLLYFFFQYSPIGKLFDKRLQHLENIGHLLIRISLGASLLASAYFYSFMGPEISVVTLPLGNFLVPVMYVLGVLLVLGIFTRVAAVLGFIILLLTTYVYGEYMFTYFNYFGEYLVLIIFGSYFLSLDNKFFGASKLIRKYKDWEIFILRTTFGLSVMYPAITIKLLHPDVIVEIYNKYHMGQIWWLFPQDPLLTSLGTGLAQILVGLFLIIGFETRFASFVTFLLYFGSIIFFQEAVWPHVVLLALAFYFVMNNGGKLTVDNYIGNILRQKKQKKSKS
jgi:uncharacterized membrane protein YphA (DoxX/SURF4 family)